MVTVDDVDGPADDEQLGATDVPRGGRDARLPALAGVALIGLGVLLLLALHVLAPDVEPLHRTLSQYGLGPWKAVFDAGVLAVAVGSAAVLTALLRTGLVRWPGAAAALLAAWVACLAVVVAFHKTDWSVGPSPAGYLHRYAGLVAFLCLPVVALLVGRDWRGDPRWARFAACTRWLGVAALAWLAPVVLGFVLEPLTGVPWWRFVPLGAFQRGAAATEIAALAVLGWWAARATP